MSNNQKTAVISIVLSAIVALLAVFGYKVIVVEPQIEALQAQIEQLAQGPQGADGDTNLTNLVLSGDLSVSGTSTLSGGVSWVWPNSLTAPTAVATATPAFYVNNLGAGNVAFEVRDAGTPMAAFYNGGGGALTGNYDVSGTFQYGSNNVYPLGNGASGKLFEFGATGNITTTVITPVAISTITAYGCSVNSPAVANAWNCGVSVSGRNITLTTYEIDATPVATPAKGVSWWVAGN